MRRFHPDRQRAAGDRPGAAAADLDASAEEDLIRQVTGENRSHEAQVTAFLKLRPRDGETFLHCGHLVEGMPFHFFVVKENVAGIAFWRPDGSSGIAKWMLLCRGCFLLHADYPYEAVVGDAVWKGNEPLVAGPEEEVQ